MPRKFFSSYRDDAIRLYNSGLTYEAIGKQLGFGTMTVHRSLSGLVASRPAGESLARAGKVRRDVIRDEVIRRFGLGESVQTIAKEMGSGVERSTVRQTLEESGIGARNRSEAMMQRMQNATPDQRKEWAKAANASMRGKKEPIERSMKQAATKFLTQSKVGKYEKEFCAYAIERGLLPIPQLPVGPYNIDIAAGNVAVEIHNTCRNPFTTPKTAKRVEYLINAGWNVIYVWCNYRVDAVPNFEHTVSFIHEAQRLPPGSREYRVIRGTGELVASRRFDLN